MVTRVKRKKKKKKNEEKGARNFTEMANSIFERTTCPSQAANLCPSSSCPSSPIRTLSMQRERILPRGISLTLAKRNVKAFDVGQILHTRNNAIMTFANRYFTRTRTIKRKMIRDSNFGSTSRFIQFERNQNREIPIPRIRTIFYINFNRTEGNIRWKIRYCAGHVNMNIWIYLYEKV